ncbi:MAG TPA: membrane dipeptidase, partial [Pyrinomonadaceae bacterium]|nr:membrane dipeptidase [Pyrinomonadaceae bacterium]
LKRIAKNGGVVMVNFFPGFIDKNVIAAAREREARLKPQLDELAAKYKDDPDRLSEERNKLFSAHPLPPTPLSVLIEHFDHIAKVAGVDHVGIGSDFDGVPSLPVGMEDISKLPNITYELLKRGYSEKDVKKILGENFMRAFAQAERVAQASSGRLSSEGSVKRISAEKK